MKMNKKKYNKMKLYLTSSFSRFFEKSKWCHLFNKKEKNKLYLAYSLIPHKTVGLICFFAKSHCLQNSILSRC